MYKVRQTIDDIDFNGEYKDDSDSWTGYLMWMTGYNNKDDRTFYMTPEEFHWAFETTTVGFVAQDGVESVLSGLTADGLE